MHATGSFGFMSQNFTRLEAFSLVFLIMLCQCQQDSFHFFKIAVLYMCSRLIVNISQVYTPQFTKRTLHNQKVRYWNIELPIVMMIVVLRINVFCALGNCGYCSPHCVCEWFFHNNCSQTFKCFRGSKGKIMVLYFIEIFHADL